MNITKAQLRRLMKQAYIFGFKEKPVYMLEMYIDEEVTKMVK